LHAAPGQTALSGQLLLLNGRPLAGVTLAIDDAHTETDQNGQFLLLVPEGGRHELLVDGRTASKGGKVYGVFEIGVTLSSEG
jgi:hypothetical protein